jgi:hypothetical protein
MTPLQEPCGCGPAIVGGSLYQIEIRFDRFGLCHIDLSLKSLVIAPPQIKDVGTDTYMLASNNKRPALPDTIEKRLHNLRRFLGWSSAVGTDSEDPLSSCMGVTLTGAGIPGLKVMDPQTLPATSSSLRSRI